MIRIKEAIIVEGTYDQIKLSQIVDAFIIITGGFSIFKDRYKMEMIRRLAEKTGIVVLTDSDRAGFLIRNYIRQQIPANQIKHAYIPEIKGVEKRKRIPGKEGLLGVEGVTNTIIRQALQNAGCAIAEGESEETKIKTPTITKAHLYEDGLIGKQDSFKSRTRLTKKLELPSRISTNALLEVLNALYTYDDYKNLVTKNT